MSTRRAGEGQEAEQGPAGSQRSRSFDIIHVAASHYGQQCVSGASTRRAQELSQQRQLKGPALTPRLWSEVTGQRRPLAGASSSPSSGRSEDLPASLHVYTVKTNSGSSFSQEQIWQEPGIRDHLAKDVLSAPQTSASLP